MLVSPVVGDLCGDGETWVAVSFSWPTLSFFAAKGAQADAGSAETI